MQNKFAFTPSKNVLIIIMNIPRPSRVDPALGPLSYIIICARNKTVARYHAIQQNKPQRFITSAEANVENILLKQMIVKKQ